MSQSRSESDIWDYKPLKKTKRKSNISDEHGAKRGKRCKSSAQKINTEDNCDEARADLGQNRDSCLTNESSHQQTPSDQEQASNSLDVQHGRSRDAQDKQAESGGFCPVCQMPFSILVVQSQQWHVAECLDTPGEESRGNAFRLCLIEVIVRSPKPLTKNCCFILHQSSL